MADEPITVEEAKQRLDAGEPVTFIDSRKEEAWRASAWQLPQARRMPADAIESFLDEIPLGGLIVPYGTSPDDVQNVARTLIGYGWTNVRPLAGGPEAWRRAGYPTESKPARRLSPGEAYTNLLNAEGD